MKTRAYAIVHSSKIVSSVDTQKGQKRVMSRAAFIATLTWHNLEPNILDEQFLVPIANLILYLELNFAIFCRYI